MTRAALSLLATLWIALPASRGQTPTEAPDTPLVISPTKIEILPHGEGYTDDTPKSGEAVESECEGKGPLRFWLRAEYLLWFVKDAQFPALLNNGSTTDPRPGAFGQPGTKVIFGGTVDFEERHGGRFSFGYFLDDENCLALEGGYMFLGSRSVGQLFSAPGLTPGPLVLARPFFNAVGGFEDSSLSAYPGLISGSVNIRTTNFFQGAEANMSLNLWQCAKSRVDGLAGFRYWRLGEDLSIEENTLVKPSAPVFAGNNIRVSDQFDTDNNFYGAQLGLRGICSWKRLDFEFVTKVALGASQQNVTTRGFTSIDTTPATQVNAGLLALSTNSGRFSRTEFAVVPEAGFNIALNVTDHCKLIFGYSFVFWDNVMRPGDQVDPVVNPNRVPTSLTFGTPGGPSRPAPLLGGSDFWAQGFNFGLEIRY